MTELNGLKSDGAGEIKFAHLDLYSISYSTVM